jgi:spore coat polysaccharide biosynthesis protein SpsF
MNAAFDLRVGAVIQARMGASRLPGKMLMDLAGATLLDHVVARLRRCDDLDTVVVATSDLAIDDPIEAACDGLNVACVRGSEEDVLGRFAQAAAVHDLEAVLRVCGDAPLIDPAGISTLIDAYRLDPGLDLVHTRHRHGWPIGAAADLISRAGLERADREAIHPDEREHVTPYLLHPDAGFRIRAIEGSSPLLDVPYYMAVDYKEDLAWFRRLYADSVVGGPSLHEVFDWIDATGDRPRVHDWDGQ